MDSNLHYSTFGNRGDSFGGEFILSLLSDVDVPVQLCTPTAIDDVLSYLRIADDGGILLAWAYISAVSSENLVD